jgi:hypothetical protein
MLLRDLIVLLLTGLVAIYMLWRFFTRYRKEKQMHDIYYMVSFGALLVAGLLLVIFTYYRALVNPFVVIIGVLIPAGLALGLVTQFFPKYGTAYLVFVLVGLVVIAITRFTVADPSDPGLLATILLVIVHAVSGTLILVLPILAANQGKTRGAFTAVSLGGLLIVIGVVVLALLRLGSQLLFVDWDMVAIVLAPFLFLMSLALAYGFVRDIRYEAS